MKTFPATTAEMPVFHQALADPALSRFDRAYSDDRLERLNAALAQWGEALQVGSIENARFAESKECISRALEHAWSRLPRNTAWVDSLPESMRNAVDSCPTPNLSNLSGRLKRLEKVPSHPTRDLLIGFIQELQPVLEAYTFLKANAKKRVVRTAEEVEATRFTPSPSSARAVGQVKALLEQVVDRAYTNLLEDLKSNHRQKIERFLTEARAKAEDSTFKPPYESWCYSPREHYTVDRRVMDSQAVAFLEKVLESDYVRGKYQYWATPATWAKSDQEAEKQALFIRQQFVFKNLQKLTPILEAKGDALFASVEELGVGVNLRFLKGSFRFKFRDSSSFEVQNDLVFVVNQWNTRFYRYPLTFHSVILPNGEPMGRPSEQRMNEVFSAFGKESAGIGQEVLSAPSKRPAARP